MSFNFNKFIINFLILLVCLISYLSISNCAYCNGKPDPNAQPNNIPIYTDSP